MSSVETAERIARAAHAGQKDKFYGHDYIEHVERVVGLVDGDTAKTVAWLHDVLEDTAVTEGDLVAAGFGANVLNPVLLLTRGEETYDEYIDMLVEQGDGIALRVKLADLDDHLRPTCPYHLRPRYEQARIRIKRELRKADAD